MKRLVLLSVTVSLLLSCQSETLMRDNNIQDENNVVYTSKIFTADFLGDTKAQLTDEYRVRWSNGDCIAVFDGKDKYDIDAEFDEETPYNATFSINQIAKTETYYAVNPASAYSSCSGSVLTINVPSEQTAIEGGCDPKALVMVAKSTSLAEETANFSFSNACGLIGFNIAEDGVTSVKITALGEDKLSGNASVTFDQEGLPEITPASDASNAVVVKGPFTKGNTYYAVVYSGDCPSGIALTYVFGEAESAKTVTWNVHKTKALPSRSKIRLLNVGAALGSMTSSASFKIGETSLITDYDANVFAKKDVSAGNLTDGNGNVIVTVPFAAARVVVDKNTGVIDVYDSDNDLQPFTVEFAIGNVESYGVLRRTVTENLYIYIGSMTDWKGRNQKVTMSEADPQVLLYSNGYNMLQGFCFKVSAEKSEVTVVKEGSKSSDYQNNTDYISKTYGFYANSAKEVTLPLKNRTDSKTAVPIFWNEWTPVLAGVGNDQFYPAERGEDGDKFVMNKIVHDYIIDIRNLRVKFTN